MNLVAKYKITDTDGRSMITIACSMNQALDLAAYKLGYTDYSDLLQSRNWDSRDDEGLNIEVIDEE